jgi:dipeptidyl aminopeptidase
MPRPRDGSEEETELLARHPESARSSVDGSEASASSISTTSLVLEHINDGAFNGARSKLGEKYTDEDNGESGNAPGRFDVEEGKFHPLTPVDKKARRTLWIVGIICALGWALALVSFLMNGNYKDASTRPHNPDASVTIGSGKKITLDSVLGGQFWPRSQSVSWIAGPDGQDGLLLEKGVSGKDYLVVEDIRSKGDAGVAGNKFTLMKKGSFQVNDGIFIYPSNVWPSDNFKKVLVMSEQKKNWRHSYTGLYWIFDVETQSGEPLDPENPTGRIQLASFSPQSDAVVFTRDNNLFLRKLDSDKVIKITQDGGSELFYGVCPTGSTRKKSFKGTAQRGGPKTANTLRSYEQTNPWCQLTQFNTSFRGPAERSLSPVKSHTLRSATSSTQRLAHRTHLSRCSFTT